MHPFRLVYLFAFLLGAASAYSALSSSTPPAGFTGVLPQDIKWIPNPAVPGGQVAVLVGDPRAPLPLVIRVKLPPNSKIMPHTHPDARTYTVLAGEWKLGFGNTYDPNNLRAFPAGSVYRLPGSVPHFQATGPEETVVQIESMGPSRTDFIGSQLTCSRLQEPKRLRGWPRGPQQRVGRF
jgi:quercetin dioxygenase-like cupin family protein